MNVIPLEVFVSLILGFSSLLLWFFTNRQGDLDEADRLALLPLDDAFVREAGNAAESSPHTPPPPAKPAAPL
jgi:hypothetical protein